MRRDVLILVGILLSACAALMLWCSPTVDRWIGTRYEVRGEEGSGVPAPNPIPAPKLSPRAALEDDRSLRAVVVLARDAQTGTTIPSCPIRVYQLDKDQHAQEYDDLITGPDGTVTYWPRRGGALSFYAGLGGSAQLTIAEDDPLTVQVEVAVRGRNSLAGIVVDSRGSPVAGAGIYGVIGPDTPSIRLGSTTETGMYAIGFLRAGCQVYAYREDIGASQLVCCEDVARDHWAQLTVRPPAGWTSIRIVDPTGSPVTAAHLVIGLSLTVDGENDKPTRVWQEVALSGSGCTQLLSLVSDRFEARAETRGSLRGTLTESVPAGQRVDLVLRLRRLEQLSGRVVNEVQEPVPNATISFVQDGVRSSPTAVSSSDGGFILHAPRSDGVVRASLATGEFIERQLMMSEWEGDLILTLPRPRTTVIQVVDDKQKPLEQWRIILTPASDIAGARTKRRVVTTGVDGKAVIEGISRNVQWRVRACPPGFTAAQLDAGIAFNDPVTVVTVPLGGWGTVIGDCGKDSGIATFEIRTDALIPVTTCSLREGRFEQRLPSGRYSLAVRRAGWLEHLMDFSIASDALTDLGMVGLSPMSYLNVLLTGPERALSLATVVVQAPKGLPMRLPYRRTMWPISLPPGAYSLSVEGDLSRSIWDKLVVPSGQSVSRSYQVAIAAPTSIEIVFARPEDAADIWLSCDRVGSDERFETEVCARRGAAVSRWSGLLTEGSWRIRAQSYWKEVYVEREVNIDTAPGTSNLFRVDVPTIDTPGAVPVEVVFDRAPRTDKLARLIVSVAGGDRVGGGVVWCGVDGGTWNCRLTPATYELKYCYAGERTGVVRFEVPMSERHRVVVDVSAINVVR